MHTSRALSSGDFEICVDGRPATVDDLLPGFDEHARRIRAAFAYSPDGRVAGADITISAAAPAEEFVCAMLGDGPRDVVGPDGRPRETFRRLMLDDALAKLETLKPDRPHPRSNIETQAFPNSVCR